MAGPWKKIGNREKANESYASIADQRDYYGFLAADRIGTEYKMNHYPLPEDLESKNKVSRLPGMPFLYFRFFPGPCHANRSSGI